MKRYLFFLLFISFVLCGCKSPYLKYYQLDENYMERRQAETRYFDTSDENLILTASTQILLDLGYMLEESEKKLGLLTGSKDREAGSVGEKVYSAILAGLSGTEPIYDVQQKIYVTLVSTKSQFKKGYNVRVEFARIIWNNKNQSRVQKIKDPVIYQDFFNKLSQSIFLTANNI